MLPVLQDLLTQLKPQQPTSNRQPGTGSIYSSGLWNWNPDLSWANNMTNRGSVNLQDFLTLDPSKLYGQDTGYLQDQLKGTIGGQLDPALMQLFNVGKRGINQQALGAQRQVGQNLASSGFRGSGANLYNDIFNTQSGALGDLSANIGGLGMQARQNAINQLLGLNSMMTDVNTGVTGQQVGVAGQLFGGGNQQNAQDQAVAATKLQGWDIPMAILGQVSGGFLGGLGAGWGNDLFGGGSAGQAR